MTIHYLPGIGGELTTTNILVSCDSFEINLGQVYTQSKWFPDDIMMVSGEYLDFYDTRFIHGIFAQGPFV